jgi:HlyD family secretion protein
MDITRAPKGKRSRYIVGGVGVLAIIAITVVLGQLKPAAPTVERSTLWIDSVRRGDMIREVRGPGTLVPMQVRYIPAVTSARVDRIIALPGQVLAPGSVLLEMSSPDVQIELLRAEQSLSEAKSALVNLRVSLESNRLSQEMAVASARTANTQAMQDATAAEALMVSKVIAPFEYNNKKAAAQEQATRLRIEQQRLTLITQAVDSQIAVQQQQISRLKAIVEFSTNRVQSLTVRAGEAGVLQEMSLQPGQWVNAGSQLAKIVQPGKLKAVLRIPETQAKDVALGQPAAIDTRNGIVKGHVSRMDPAAVGGTVTVDVAIDDPLPAGARPDLNVDGTIQLERLQNIVFTGRPAVGQDGGTIGIFRLEPDGKSAVRVQVKLGRTSVNAVEIIKGLNVGEKIILSDMSANDNADRVRIK